jgi:hypothetical protein
LALFVAAHNLGSFLRRRLLPPQMARWCLTTPREKLVKIGARLTRHVRQVVLQMAEVAVTRDSLAQILSRIRHLEPVPTQGSRGLAVSAEEAVVLTDAGVWSRRAPSTATDSSCPKRHRRR